MTWTWSARITQTTVRQKIKVGGRFDSSFVYRIVTPRTLGGLLGGVRKPKSVCAVPKTHGHDISPPVALLRGRGTRGTDGRRRGARRADLRDPAPRATHRDRPACSDHGPGTSRLGVRGVAREVSFISFRSFVRVSESRAELRGMSMWMIGCHSWDVSGGGYIYDCARSADGREAHGRARSERNHERNVKTQTQRPARPRARRWPLRVVPICASTLAVSESRTGAVLREHCHLIRPLALLIPWVQHRHLDLRR